MVMDARKKLILLILLIYNQLELLTSIWNDLVLADFAVINEPKEIMLSSWLFLMQADD